jgi:hypothetical protein
MQCPTHPGYKGKQERNIHSCTFCWGIYKEAHNITPTKRQKEVVQQPSNNHQPPSNLGEQILYKMRELIHLLRSVYVDPDYKRFISKNKSDLQRKQVAMKRRQSDPPDAVGPLESALKPK